MTCKTTSSKGRVPGFISQPCGLGKCLLISNSLVIRWISLVAQMLKESACNAGDLGSVSGLGRSLEKEKGYPLQYSCLDNSMDRGAWQATVHGVTKSQI